MGNRIRERLTARSVTASSEPGTNSGISTGATRMNSAVRAPSTSVTTKIKLVVSRNASRRAPCSSFSVNTGTNAAWIAASANRLRTRFGTWKAIVNADIAPLTPKYEAAKISRTSPAMRESPVAREKNAVERARRPARGLGARSSSWGETSASATSASSPSEVSRSAPEPRRSAIRAPL